MEVDVITKGAALEVLDRKPGVWFCMRCWATALGADEGVYADLRDLVRNLASEKTNVSYETAYNDPGAISCDIQGAGCEKKLAGVAAYSGWRWSIRRNKV